LLAATGICVLRKDFSDKVGFPDLKSDIDFRFI
jgi:hypothetical protein